MCVNWMTLFPLQTIGTWVEVKLRLMHSYTLTLLIRWVITYMYENRFWSTYPVFLPMLGICLQIILKFNAL